MSPLSDDSTIPKPPFYTEILVPLLSRADRFGGRPFQSKVENGKQFLHLPTFTKR